LGGGVYNRGTFRIVTGTIYGSNENDISLKNYTKSGHPVSGETLFIHENTIQAEYGTFNGDEWVSSGDLSTTNDTVRVVDGILQLHL
jgi:hypothetical protein